MNERAATATAATAAAPKRSRPRQGNTIKPSAPSNTKTNTKVTPVMTSSTNRIIRPVNQSQRRSNTPISTSKTTTTSSVEGRKESTTNERRHATSSSSACSSRSQSPSKKWWLQQSSDTTTTSQIASDTAAAAAAAVANSSNDDDVLEIDMTEALLDALEDEAKLQEIARMAKQANIAAMERQRSFEMAGTTTTSQQQLQSCSSIPSTTMNTEHTVDNDIQKKMKAKQFSKRKQGMSPLLQPLPRRTIHTSSSADNNNDNDGDDDEGDEGNDSQQNPIHVRRAYSLGPNLDTKNKNKNSNNTTDTKEVEAIIQQETKARKVFTVEWGVGDANTFLTELREKGRLWSNDSGGTAITPRANTKQSKQQRQHQPSSSSCPSKTVQRALSWEDLERKMQTSVLQKAEEFKNMPKLKKAAFVLILSQLLTPTEREELYQVYSQMEYLDNNSDNNNNNDRRNNRICHHQKRVLKKDAQAGYAKVFGTPTSKSPLAKTSTDATATATATTTTSDGDSENVVMDYTEFICGAAIASYHQNHHHNDTMDSAVPQSQKRRLENLSGESLRKAFSTFDNEGKGFITRENLVNLCSRKDATTERIINTVLNRPDDDSEINENGNTAASDHDDETHSKSEFEKSCLSFADFVSLFFDDDISTSSGDKLTKATNAKKKKVSRKDNKKDKKKKRDKKKRSKKSKLKKRELKRREALKRMLSVGDLSIDDTVESSDGEGDNDDNDGTLRNDLSIDDTYSSSSSDDSTDEDEAFDWKSHTKTRKSLQVKAIMAKKKAQESKAVNGTKNTVSPSLSMAPSSSPKNLPQTIEKQRPNDSTSKTDNKIDATNLPADSPVLKKALKKAYNTAIGSVKFPPNVPRHHASPTTHLSPAIAVASPGSLAQPCENLPSSPNVCKKQWPPVATSKPTVSQSHSARIASTAKTAVLPSNGARGTVLDRYQPIKLKPPPPPPVDPCDKAREDEARALARLNNNRPPMGAMGPKLSKAFLWELKSNQKDLSRALKPVIKRKDQKKAKIVDPDRPYDQELREVQAAVLPVWRKETYSYWI